MNFKPHRDMDMAQQRIFAMIDAGENMLVNMDIPSPQIVAIFMGAALGHAIANRHSFLVTSWRFFKLYVIMWLMYWRGYFDGNKPPPSGKVA